MEEFFIFFGSSSDISLNIIRKLVSTERKKVFYLFYHESNKVFEFKHIKNDINQILFKKIDLSDTSFDISILTKEIKKKFKPKKINIFFVSSKVSKIDMTSNEIEQNIYINSLHYIKLINSMISEFKNTSINLNFISTISVLKFRINNSIYSISKNFMENYLYTLSQNETKYKSLSIKIYRLGFILETNKNNILKRILSSNYQQISNYIYKNSNLDHRFKIFYYPIIWNFLSKIIKLIPIRIFNRFDI